MARGPGLVETMTSMEITQLVGVGFVIAILMWLMFKDNCE